MSASTDFLVPPAQRLIQNLLRTLHWPLLVGLLLSAVLLSLTTGRYSLTTGQILQVIWDAAHGLESVGATDLQKAFRCLRHVHGLGEGAGAG